MRAVVDVWDSIEKLVTRFGLRDCVYIGADPSGIEESLLKREALRNRYQLSSHDLCSGRLDALLPTLASPTLWWLEVASPVSPTCAGAAMSLEMALAALAQIANGRPGLRDDVVVCRAVDAQHETAREHMGTTCGAGNGQCLKPLNKAIVDRFAAAVPMLTPRCWNHQGEILALTPAPFAPGNSYYLEYGGGLGDILEQLDTRPGYRGLMELGPDDEATVCFICHNPHAHELVRWHPKATQIKAIQPGYWWPHEHWHYKSLHGLPDVHPPREQSGPTIYYPSPDDRHHLEALPNKYVAICASAGLPERTIPADIVAQVVHSLQSQGIHVVMTGRNYDRHGRFEHHVDRLWNGTDLVDKLSVPGTAWAVEKAMGVFTSHSSMHVVATRRERPQLLLYPSSVADYYCRELGRQYSTMKHGVFHAFSDLLMAKFTRTLTIHDVVDVGDRSLLSRDRRMELFNAVVESAGVPGEMIMLGVFRGGSARIIANAAPDRRLFACDTFAGVPYTDPSIDGVRVGEFAASQEDVHGYLDDCPNVTLVSGVFPESWTPCEQRFSFAYCDADTYRSTRDFLRVVYPQMSAGGVMVFDDYGWHECRGVAAAVDEFFKDRPEKPQLFVPLQAVIVKK